ncbi:MAG: UDP-N-acetylmuramoylalanyl-D-glutamate--2,6-diaminopimelate ligase [Peptococcaceae bacterium BICA1-7]|nr:MAG: UDP-N-acetylmuramoylalanyl-D-glutamate--2,6-diaminopimelate ligase [Peptococcaceae bacterium BICA1-7]HBV99008.1 UDP-N-acetylmuramoyl-L-alanyl-D-glutamate--2,6-diaminopimelate ligase [Desulfotomaculum sp.]
MLLNDLLKSITVLNMEGDGSTDIRGICYDSRKVRPGSLFVAVEGFKNDGHNYVGRAVEAGASAVLAQRMVEVPPGVPLVITRDTRKGLAMVSAAFYGNPSRELLLVGVTGTNGKTTTTSLIASIYRAAGKKVGLIGTIANYIGDRKLEAGHTTPESADLQEILRDMVSEGVSVAVMEVSSHALSLERVAGCEFDVAVFTNLTQDHLDFHRDMEEYLEAKAHLFRSIGDGKRRFPSYAVVNADDPHMARIAEASGAPVVTYGLSEKADMRAVDIKVTGRGCSFTAVSGKYGSTHLSLRLTGLFNVYNALAAYTMAVEGGFSPDLVKEALEGVPGVPGRFETVDCGQDFTVVVDYAHTPDGLENILKAAGTVATGRVIAVFGCGGDRDRTKRPIMGEIAGRYSQVPIITSDNPRTEAPDVIIRDIEEGIKRVAPNGYRVIPDRREAIRLAVSVARSGDMVVIAGKGHEDYQIIGTQKLPFDDREEVKKVLEALVKKK